MLRVRRWRCSSKDHLLPSMRNVAGYAYLTVIGGALTYVLWFRGLRSLSATRVSFLGLLSPIVATTRGWSVLGQDLTAGQAAGGVLALSALLLVQATRATGPSSNEVPIAPSGPRQHAVHVALRVHHDGDTAVVDQTGVGRPGAGSRDGSRSETIRRCMPTCRPRG